MRSIAIAVLLASAAVAQTVVDPAKLGDVPKALAPQPGGRPLQCRVMPIKPALDFGFRFQAGYVVRVPMSQYSGPGHKWAMLTRITPEGGGRKPVYLLSGVRLPPIPRTNLELEIGGGYLLGEGRYDVSWAMFDDAGRTCRGGWRVDARLGRRERRVKVAMPRGAVGEFSSRVLPNGKRDSDDAPPLRLTVLLHVAPLVPFRTRLRASDRVMLLGLLSTLLERLPARSVRLVVFNLDQQKELFRQEAFPPEALDQVAQSINGLELGRVDYHVLQNRLGHVDLLAGLVNRELQAEAPSDVVVFLGPEARYWDKLPEAALEEIHGAEPRFFYLEYKPPYFRPGPNIPDSISSAVGKLKGKTVVIRSPADLANAIEEIERRAAAPK
ncbi:MAG: hypothetical protein ABSH44_17490 [Bryobacteraceae bacterium]|jgi:hypothetical protein